MLTNSNCFNTCYPKKYSLPNGNVYSIYYHRIFPKCIFTEGNMASLLFSSFLPYLESVISRDLFKFVVIESMCLTEVWWLLPICSCVRVSTSVLVGKCVCFVSLGQSNICLSRPEINVFFLCAAHVKTSLLAYKDSLVYFIHTPTDREWNVETTNSFRPDWCKLSNEYSSKVFSRKAQIRAVWYQRKNKVPRVGACNNSVLKKEK